MTCEEIEQALLGIEVVPQETIDAHLAACAACRAFASDIGPLTKAESISSAEQRDVNQLASVVSAAWSASRAVQPSRASQWLKYALAAGVGSLITAASLTALQRQPVSTVATVAPAVNTGGAVASNDVLNDESFDIDEVSWPVASEGEYE